jgi:hypothetical protein
VRWKSSHSEHSLHKDAWYDVSAATERPQSSTRLQQQCMTLIATPPLTLLALLLLSLYYTLQSIVLQALLQWVSAWTRAYKRIMSWESPLLTATALAGFLYITLIASAEYVLASLPCGILAYIAHAGLARRDGRYVQHW